MTYKNFWFAASLEPNKMKSRKLPKTCIEISGILSQEAMELWKALLFAVQAAWVRFPSSSTKALSHIQIFFRFRPKVVGKDEASYYN